MNRIKWVDNLKGFILLLVCIGHLHYRSGWGLEVSSMCAAFRMTTFLFLSGYLFSVRRHATFSSYLKSKTKSLLVPYICLSVVFSFLDLRLYDVSLIPRHRYTNYLILSHLGVPETIQNSLQYLYLEFVNIFISGTSTPITTPLWFVNVLFWSSLLFYLVHHSCKGNKIVILLYAILCISIGWICNKGHYFLPFNFHVVFSGSFYFSMGYIAHDFIKNKLHQLSSISLFLLLIPIFLIYLYGINVNGAISLYTNSLGGKLYGLLISSLSGIFMVITFFILISRIPRTSLIGGLFRNLARNALIFLAMHYFIIITSDILFPQYSRLTSFKNIVLIAALVISFISFPLFRNKLYWLLGKKKISVKESLSLE